MVLKRPFLGIFDFGKSWAKNHSKSTLRVSRRVRLHDGRPFDYWVARPFHWYKWSPSKEAQHQRPARRCLLWCALKRVVRVRMGRMRYPENKSNRNQGGRVWQAAQSEFGILTLNCATRYGLRPHRAPDTRAEREGLSRVLGSHGWCGDSTLWCSFRRL